VGDVGRGGTCPPEQDPAWRDPCAHHPSLACAEGLQRHPPRAVRQARVFLVARLTAHPPFDTNVLLAGTGAMASPMASPW
jgi:hypothetical protein